MRFEYVTSKFCLVISFTGLTVYSEEMLNMLLGTKCISSGLRKKQVQFKQNRRLNNY